MKLCPRCKDETHNDVTRCACGYCFDDQAPSIRTGDSGNSNIEASVLSSKDSKPIRILAGLTVATIMSSIGIIGNLFQIANAASTVQPDALLAANFMSGLVLVAEIAVLTGCVLSWMGQQHGLRLLRAACWTGVAFLFIRSFFIPTVDQINPVAARIGATLGVAFGALIHYGIPLLLIRGGSLRSLQRIS